MSSLGQPVPKPSVDTLQPGDILGTYQLLCSVAHGGMGQIWAARRTGRLGLPKLVAVKTALPLTDHAPEFMEKLFFDEARVAASIDHPNVCRVYELGDANGILYLAMEWIEGASLSTILGALGGSRRMDHRLAAHVVAQACAGLHAAHELTDEDGVPLGVVHRDATPHNILITTQGDVKVVDFGIVKSRDQSHQATMTGELKGKVSYVPPEQLLAKKVDRRADIFTLGCVLYVATVGQRPFGGDSTGETLLRIVEGEYKRPSTVLPDYPPTLEAIIVRALARQPIDRFQTADEMRCALEEFLLEGEAAVSREALAALVNQYLGESLEARRVRIRAAQRTFESQSGEHRIELSPVYREPSSLAPSVSKPPALPLRPSSAPTAIAQAPEILWVDRPGEDKQTAGSPASTVQRRRTTPLLWGALVVVPLLVGLGLFRWGQRSGSPPAPMANAQSQERALPPSSLAQVARNPASETVAASIPPPSHETPILARSAPASAARAAARVPQRRVNQKQPETEGANPAPQREEDPFAQTVKRTRNRRTIDETDPFRE